MPGLLFTSSNFLWRISIAAKQLFSKDPRFADEDHAWKVLAGLTIPFMTAFSDEDPVSRGVDEVFQKKIAGCAGQNHVTIEAGGHFLQEDKGEELADVVATFISDNKIGA